MNDKLNIEQLFKSKLEGMELTPSPSSWVKTSRKLRRREFVRFRANRFNIYYAIGAVLIGTVLTVSLFDEKVKGDPSATGSTSSPRRLSDRETVDSSQSTVASSQSTVASPQSTVASSQSSVDSPQSPVVSRQSSVDSSKETVARRQEAVDSIQVYQSAGSNGSEIVKSEEQENSKVATLIAFFTPSVYDGCVPLMLELVNSSLNASSFKWVINGEEWKSEVGGRKSEVGSRRSEFVTFEESGVYTVTLLASNELGVQVSHTEQITVHPKPKADFEIEGEQVYNYSSGANEYEWKLLHSSSAKATEDRERVSTEFQPGLEAALRLEPKASHLLLVARNNFGCSDSTSQLIPKTLESGLLFPSAFSPNPGGATGGYYNRNEAYSTVFYPKYSEKPARYKLQIFNKAGELIYTSTNIELGWDGYYKEAAAPQGVYIYQCSGTWQNGKPFNYKGDITLLLKE